MIPVGLVLASWHKSQFIFMYWAANASVLAVRRFRRTPMSVLVGQSREWGRRRKRAGARAPRKPSCCGECGVFCWRSMGSHCQESRSLAAATRRCPFRGGWPRRQGDRHRARPIVGGRSDPLETLVQEAQHPGPRCVGDQGLRCLPCLARRVASPDRLSRKHGT